MTRLSPHPKAAVDSHKRSTLGRIVLSCVATPVMSASWIPLAARAAAWPDKPIRLVVQFAAGGSTDVLGRVVAQAISGPLGQTIVVDNRPGAGGNIATEFVARAPKDGYTLMVGGANNAINASLYKKLSFDFEKDLTAIAILGVTPNVMIVAYSSAVGDARAFLQRARSLGRPITFASSGIGSSLHLTGEIFETATGLPMTHVPYKGSNPALVDLMSGNVDVMFDSVISASPLVKQGKLKALAVTGSAPSPALPGVPTLKASGVDVEALSFIAFYAPAGTPAPIITRLNAEIRAALKSAEVAARMAEVGVEVRDLAPDEAGRFIRAQTELWRKAVAASGATAD